jgi:mRNA-degrading endonuclease toxin of MazEF toxin-antitoxin module
LGRKTRRRKGGRVMDYNVNKYDRQRNAREAYLKRLQTYWKSRRPMRFNTYVGEIYEIDFGENVGSEFSGRHLGICLNDTKITEDRVLVIPITSAYVKYNLTDIVKCTSFVDGKPIEGGVVLNEVRFISKVRIFKTSNILQESEEDDRIAVGKIELTKEQLERFRRIDV